MSTRTAPAAEAGVLEAAALAAEHLDLLILGAVRDIHGSVSGRVHAVLDHVVGGPTQRPFLATPGPRRHRLWHLRRSRLGLRASATALRQADRFGLGPAIEDGARGRFVVSAVNGLIATSWWPTVRRWRSRSGYASTVATYRSPRTGLAQAYPHATEAIVVFLHGLCETENYWDPAQPAAPGRRHLDRVVRRAPAADEGWSPVFVRANTGVTLAEAGVALSSLLSRLVASWPTEVTRIAPGRPLDGRPDGPRGLRGDPGPRRSSTGESPWTDKVTDIVTLGAPHTGSPVERTIARGIRVAARAPELMPFARIFEQRSVGVLDLHDGMPEDDAPLPHARYHLVAATLSRSPKHPVAATVGDYLVQYRSAVGLLPGDVEMFPGADVLHVPGADHFDLLNHDDVYAALRGWLAHTGSTSTPRS